MPGGLVRGGSIKRKEKPNGNKFFFFFVNFLVCACLFGFQQK